MATDGTAAAASATSTSNKRFKTSGSGANGDLKIYSFALQGSPTEVEVLETHTLYDFVKIALEVFNPRDGDTVTCHLWKITVGEIDKFLDSDFDSDSDEEPAGPLYTNSQARKVRLGNLNLNINSKLNLEYDYGSTSLHTFTLTAIDRMDVNVTASDFPRRKPAPAQPVIDIPMDDGDDGGLDLNEAFPSLNKWCFGSKEKDEDDEEEDDEDDEDEEEEDVPKAKEINLFQAGRKQNVHGWLETSEAGMILVADKAANLQHYLHCLEVASDIKRSSSGGGYPDFNWHSVVILPQTAKTQSNPPKRWGAYQQGLQPGFCDCKIVPEQSTASSSMTADERFPKLCAFAGFGKKSSKAKKGWLRYKDGVLLLCTGTAGSMAHPNAPKGTAYEGEGCHVPSSMSPSSEDILVRLDRQFESLQELFCAAESLLGTL